jgi:hypothetical protein
LAIFFSKKKRLATFGSAELGITKTNIIDRDDAHLINSLKEKKKTGHEGANCGHALGSPRRNGAIHPTSAERGMSNFETS